MGHLIPEVILIGLGAAVSPVAIMILLSIMVKKNARRNSLLFLAGFTVVLVAIGIVGLLVFGAGDAGRHPASFDGWIDIALGLICVALIPYAWKKKPRQQKPEDEGMKPWRAFTLGSIAMFINTSTFVLYVSGTHAIAQAKGITGLDEGVAFVVLTLATLISLLVPIAIYQIFPGRSEKLMDALGAWLARHSKIITVVILLIFAVFLLWKGISQVA